MAERDAFLGAWVLEDWTVKEPGKPTRHPFGTSAKGYLIYDAKGVMSATLMKEDRPCLKTARSQMTASIGDAIELMDTEGRFNLFSSTYFRASVQYMGYCGRYTIDESVVTHHVEAALIPDWVGKDLVRSYVLHDDLLSLTTEEHGMRDQLTWRRIASRPTA
ncbi:MAG: lipocalin-like domain-containing protein [Pseudomonadota bacterium]